MTTAVLLLLISFIIVSGAFVFINTKSDDEAHAQLSAPNDTKQDVDPVTDEIVDFDSKLSREENHAIASSFENEVEEPSEAVIEKVSDNIHRMTHQKVRAEHKWGHLRITDERIDEMISLLEQYDVPDRTFLHEEMLNWKNGDYSNSVEIHNTLTQISDYSVRIGKTYGLLQPAEEQRFINQKYADSDDVPQEEYAGYQEIQRRIEAQSRH